MVGTVTWTGRGPGGMTGWWEGKLSQDTPVKPAAPGPRPLLPTAPPHTMAGSCPAPRRPQDGLVEGGLLFLDTHASL